MARIRTIKPDFWTNEKILSIKPLTRLLFIGMWNFADDYGRLDFSPISIKAKIFPVDQMAADDVRNMLNELRAADLLKIYSANGKEYIEITGWDHQRIDKRQTSKIPGPFDECSSIRGIPPTPADFPQIAPTPAPVMEGNGREWRGGEGKQETREVALSDGWPSDFENLFWEIWPNPVGKKPALKALACARKRGADWDAIMIGLANYIRDKPPDRQWLNPATFLNQNRWEDQPATVSATNGKPKSAIIQAADDLCERLASFDGPKREPDELRSAEGKAPARLLSHG